MWKDKYLQMLQLIKKYQETKSVMHLKISHSNLEAQCASPRAARGHSDDGIQ